jgi:hypothetical protein
MNAQYVFKLPEDRWAAQLAAIARMGVGVVREDAFWSEVEHQPPVDGRHDYDWSRPDAIITALARQGLRWYPILDYATPWDGTLAGVSGWKSAPKDPADFAAYTAAFARRYGVGGSFWATNPSLPALPVQTYEIWNEPNRSDFWPTVTGAADRYGELLALATPAIRAADPAGHVVVGGLSPSGLVEFLNVIEARYPKLIAQMDGVAFHPYGTTFANTGARIRILREWLDQHGAGSLPIEITETGWATPPLSESERAMRMNKLVQGLPLSSCGISRIIPYTWMTFEAEPANPEEWFGIANLNATLKPTGVALEEAIKAVRAGTAMATSDPCAGLGGSSSGGLGASQPGSGSGVLEQGSGATEQGPGAIEQGPDPLEQGSASAAPETSPGSSALSPDYAPVQAAGTPTTGAQPTSGGAATRSGLAAARPTAPAHIAVHARERGRAITVQVVCSVGCRPTVSLEQSGSRPMGSSAGHRFVRRYRVTLHAPRRGKVRVRVVVRFSGAPPRTLTYKLH